MGLIYNYQIIKPRILDFVQAAIGHNFEVINLKS